MHDISMEISIPTDNEGYVLLQCPYCGDFFKISPFDFNDERLLDIYCPSCGLIGENYITEDVLQLAIKMIENAATDTFYREIKKMEKKINGGIISLKVGKKPKSKNESPIRAGVEALEIAEFNCCKRCAKIKPMLKISGCICPFCGVKNYEFE